MSQIIPTQPLPEQDRIELMISRTVVPRLSAIEGQMQVFNNLLNQISTRQREEQERLGRKVDNISQILNGDGKEDGLIAIVHDNQDWISWGKKLMWFLFTTTFVETVGIIVVILKDHVLKLP